MDHRCNANFFLKIEKPEQYRFLVYLGYEVFVGLEALNENDNKVVVYFNGIVGIEKRKPMSLGLFESTDEDGNSNGNKIISIEEGKIVEAYFPQLPKIRCISSEGLEIKVSSEPCNPNSKKIDTYLIKNKNII